MSNPSDAPAAPLPSASRPPAASSDDGRSPFAVARPWKAPFIAMVIMIALALVGVAFTTARSEWAPRYWMALVPTYGVLCVITAWDRSRRDPRFRRPGILRQVFHWLGIGLALWLGFYIRHTGEETDLALGDNSLLLLALGCFLAGVHLEWLFAVVGLLLMLTFIIAVQVEEYIWLVFVISGVVVVGLFFLRRWLARKHKVGTAQA